MTISTRKPDDSEDTGELSDGKEPPTGEHSETLVRRAIPGDVSRMAAVLGRVMAQDPGICWMFPRSRTRQRVLPEVFAATILCLCLPAGAGLYDRRPRCCGTVAPPEQCLARAL
jgi:hypothetical protein